MTESKQTIQIAILDSVWNELAKKMREMDMLSAEWQATFEARAVVTEMMREIAFQQTEVMA